MRMQSNCTKYVQERSHHRGIAGRFIQSLTGERRMKSTGDDNRTRGPVEAAFRGAVPLKCRCSKSAVQKHPSSAPSKASS